jgi:hypothetical protein
MRHLIAVVVLVGLVGCAEEKATLEEARVQVPCELDPTQMCAVGCEQGEPLGRACKVIDNVPGDFGYFLSLMNWDCLGHRSFKYGGLTGCCDTQWWRCE